MAAIIDQQCDRTEMLRAFDQTGDGVKGLIDSGMLEIPKIFVRSPEELVQDVAYKTAQIQIPVIDLSEIQNPDRRKQIVEEVRIASETWGFFQVVNHGIPVSVVDEVIDGVQKFNEQDVEEKRKYYSRDNKKKVSFVSNYDLFSSRSANWRDTMSISFSDKIPSEELPPICRESIVKFSNEISVFRSNLLELLSQGLGLKPDHLHNMDVSKGQKMKLHYYPACPQPQLTIGTTAHRDIAFLAILVQNGISGLQVLYQDQWVNVDPTPGALVVNIGDLLELVSNGKYLSSMHRVMATTIGPRISVACFNYGPYTEVKSYAPIIELISEQNPAKYKDVFLSDYMDKFLKSGLDEYLGLEYYKL